MDKLLQAIKIGKLSNKYEHKAHTANLFSAWSGGLSLGLEVGAMVSSGKAKTDLTIVGIAMLIIQVTLLWLASRYYKFSKIAYQIKWRVIKDAAGDEIDERYSEN